MASGSVVLALVSHFAPFPGSIRVCRHSSDFTVYDAGTGVTWYWEHLGMLADSAYTERWERKQEFYAEHGIGGRREPHSYAGCGQRCRGFAGYSAGDRLLLYVSLPGACICVCLALVLGRVAY